MDQNLDFDELEGASITEKRRAIDLAYRRYSWWKDKQYMKKCFVVLTLAVGLTSAILLLLPDSSWLLPVVLLSSGIINYQLRPIESERIRPLLRRSLDDVRRHAHM